MKRSRYTDEANRLRAAAGGERHGSRRRLPPARHQRSDLLRVEEEVREPGSDGAARTAAVARRERQAQASPGGSHARQARPERDRAKKSLTPARRREPSARPRDQSHNDLRLEPASAGSRAMALVMGHPEEESPNSRFAPSMHQNPKVPTETRATPQPAATHATNALDSS